MLTKFYGIDPTGKMAWQLHYGLLGNLCPPNFAVCWSESLYSFGYMIYAEDWSETLHSFGFMNSMPNAPDDD